MVFPAVWAVAMVGTHANGMTRIVNAIADAIEMVTGWKRRIQAPSVVNRESV
jgi:hypothetical protein